MNIAKVSIALATYNGEKYLQEQLNSLANQVLLPAELVVGDDGSTDRTLEILENFAKTAPFPVHVTRNDRNLGFSENFFQTARRCSSPWVAFCDQDDIWLSSKLSVLATAASSHPDAFLIVSNNVRFTEGIPIKASLRSFLHVAYSRLRYPKRSPFRPVEGHRMLIRSLLFTVPWQDRPSRELLGQAPHDIWLNTLCMLMHRRLHISARLTLHRRHEAAASYQLVDLPTDNQTKTNGLAISRSRSFREQSKYWEQIHAWCTEKIGSAPDELIEPLETAAKGALIVSDWYRMRSQMYLPNYSKLRATSNLMHVIYHGGYSVGFGIIPFIKDLILVLTMAPRKK